MCCWHKLSFTNDAPFEQVDISYEIEKHDFVVSLYMTFRQDNLKL